MNELKTTSCPWQVEAYVEPYNNVLKSYNVVSDGLIVAKCGADISHEIYANACLIAAAPDLYNALFVVENIIPESPYKEIVKKALLKARGQ